MMKWLLRLIGLAILAAALLVGVGAMVEREHVASSRARYTQPPQAVWDLITDFEAAPLWRAEIEQVKDYTVVDGLARYVEVSSFGDVPYRVEVLDPPRRMVSRIDSEDLGFGGTWTFLVEPDGDGSSLTITEDGVIDNLMFRTLSRYVFGYHHTQQEYLRAVGVHFGETVEPQVVH
jgi:uncharacterized protein YndB with AHSA1/START domain